MIQFDEHIFQMGWNHQLVNGLHVGMIMLYAIQHEPVWYKGVLKFEDASFR